MYMRKDYKGLVIGLGIFGAVFSSACNGISVEHDDISIIPLPYNMVVEKDEFVITEKSTIGGSDKSLVPAAEYLVGILNKSTGYKLVIREGKGDINLSLSTSKEGDGYSLVSTSDEVTISGNSYAGVIYGIATLRQLLPHQIESNKVVEGIDWAIPAVNIKDTPRFQ